MASVVSRHLTKRHTCFLATEHVLFLRLGHVTFDPPDLGSLQHYGWPFFLLSLLVVWPRPQHIQLQHDLCPGLIGLVHVELFTRIGL
jgi:hypothetical protein